MRSGRKKIWYIVYSLTGKWMPISRHFKLGKKIRVWFARKVLLSAGEHINIERGACFAEDTSIGNNSALGINCHIQEGGVSIGDNVLMGPDVWIFTTNHNFSDITKPICMQGNEPPKAVVIEDDCWIGSRVTILPGVRVKKGCVVGAGTVLTKTYPEYSVIVGNPGKVVKSRNE